MKWILGLLILVACSAQALSPLPFGIVSSYDQNSRIPGALIPFRLVTSLPNASVQSVTITAPIDKDCRVMLDPFINTSFLLKCAVPANVQMTVRVVSGLSVYDINYGPVSVTAPFSNVVVVPPGPGPAENPDVLAGRQLFYAYCNRCHLATQKPDRKVAQMRNALQNVNDMKSMNSVLKDTDLKKIEIYLEGF